MNTQTFKKLLVLGTAIVAVGALGSTKANAAAVTASANGVWSSAGTNADDGTLAEAQAGEALDLGNFTVTVTNDGTANDSGGTGTFTLGAVTDTGTGSLAVTTNASGGDVAATVASVDIAGNLSATNTDAHNNTVAATISAATTVGGTLTVSNTETTTADDVSLTSTGALTVTGASTVTGGSFAGATSTLTVTAAATFTGGLTLNDNTTDATLVVNGTAAQTIAGSIQGATAGEGVINVTNTHANGATFSGSVGGTTALDNIVINNNGSNVKATFTGNVNASNGISVGNNAGTDTNTLVLSSASSTITVAGAINGGGAADTNNLSILGTNTVNISNAVGSNIDAVTIDAAGTVAFGSTLASNLTYNAAGTATFANDVTGNVDFNNNNGTATFADNADITGNILGTGGSYGSVTFAGTSTVTGNIGTSSGNRLAALNVNGTNETTTVTGDIFTTLATVAATNTLDLGDDLTMTGTLTNNGTINVNTGGVLAVDGGFAGTGTYNIEVADDADGTLNAADLGLFTSVSAINLAGETINFDLTGDVANGTINFGAGGAAAVVGGTVTDDSLVKSFALTASGNNVVLTVSQSSSGLGTTTNNQNVGTVLDALSGTTNTQLDQIEDVLVVASTNTQVNEILEAAGPTVDGGTVVAGLQVANENMDITNQRLASLRTGSGETGMVAGSVAQGLKYWGQVHGTTGTQDKRSGIDGYDVDSYGVAMGLDTKAIDDNWTVGAAVGYALSEVDSENANTTKSEIDSYQVSLYAENQVDERTYVNGQVGYVFNQNETTRHNVGGVSGLTANGEYDSNQYLARVETGRDYKADGNMTLTPKLMANYVHYTADDYTETGAGGANLNVDNESLNLFEVGVGADASWLNQMPDGAYVKPVIHAGVRHDLIGDNVQTTNNFTGGGATFKAQGADPAQTTFDAGAGVTYFATSNWELSADYDFEYKKDYTAHSGLLKAAYKF